ncbi:MAG TPA: tRNA pseudouridine(55) synthase TruB [Deltaproteobacteria bacterium]|nr:tRNA pseudouridine(55) synthase TruB [Deltaproteobacteria bacterium]HOI06380.1 tRNA pseudouridine(55) synthase TruB [Deltaproteobacteria bacterium]
MGKQGIVLVDKAHGLTSRRVVDHVMKILKVKRAGHFGSLDPFATGLLCVGIGQGTKLLPFMHAQQKEYIATIGFDMTTDTDDITGRPLERFDGVNIDIEAAKAWFMDNLGWINQVPPKYCAQKYQGKPLYKLTRANVDVQPREKQVYIEDAEVLGAGPDWMEVRIVCSRGTYIRSIARDLGEHLGHGGYLRALRRLRSEGFHVSGALTLEGLQEKDEAGEDVVIPLSNALHIPKSRVIPAGQKGILEGNPIQFSWVKDDVEVSEGNFVAMMSLDGQLLCVARYQPSGGIWGYIERGFRPD